MYTEEEEIKEVADNYKENWERTMTAELYGKEVIDIAIRLGYNIINRKRIVKK